MEGLVPAMSAVRDFSYGFCYYIRGEREDMGESRKYIKTEAVER